MSRYRENYYVEACCGETKTHQNLLKCASQTMVHVNVFKQCLKNVGRWDPALIREPDIDKTIERAKPATTTWGDETFQCKGPFSIPIAIDGVWVYQLGVVTTDWRIKDSFVLGQQILDSACLRRAVDWYGRILLGEHSSALVTIIFLHEVIKVRALLDTGAGPSIMTENLWIQLGKPALKEAYTSIYAADRSEIAVIGKTSPLMTVMGRDQETTVS